MLIAGPTASGKSSLALQIAEATGGVIVNADSMQVYDGLRVLTARPSDADLARAPHRLDGHVPPEVVYSTGAFARDAARVLGEIRAAGRPAIVCGGTGLYLRALLGGIDDMPAIDPAMRARWRARMAGEGSAALHAELERRDPAAAARIRPGDPQRTLRALELIEATGGPLSALQKGAGAALVDAARAVKIVLVPPRDALRARIAERFEAMLAAGALGEVEAFLARPGIAGGPAAKAIGVAELAAHLAGDLPLGEAAARAVTRSRQYAKRQDTWFRHQLGADWRRVAHPGEIDLGAVRAALRGD